MAASQARLFRPVSRLTLYVAFAMTGVVTNLLGPILPSLEQRWQLNDQRAGELFILQFAFSTLAAIFAGRNPRLTAPLGMLLAASGVLLLAEGGQQTGRFAVGLYGAGLGLAITSMNLLVAGESDVARKSSEIAWMNLIWVIGAVAFPALYSVLPRAGFKGLLIGIASVAAVAGAAVAVLFPAQRRERPSGSGPPEFHVQSLLFAMFFFLYVGAEVGIAGWLPTYVDRQQHSLTGSAAVAVFWGAVLAGRLVLPMLYGTYRHRRMLFTFLFLSLAASIALPWAKTPATVLLVSTAAGLGLAPLFPLNLAVFAHSFPDHRNSGWVLACAGLGAAALPAIMGIVSTRNGSLRVALIVPVLALTALLAIASSYREPQAAGVSPS